MPAFLCLSRPQSGSPTSVCHSVSPFPSERLFTGLRVTISVRLGLSQPLRLPQGVPPPESSLLNRSLSLCFIFSPPASLTLSLSLCADGSLSLRLSASSLLCRGPRLFPFLSTVFWPFSGLCLWHCCCLSVCVYLCYCPFLSLSALLSAGLCRSLSASPPSPCLCHSLRVSQPCVSLSQPLAWWRVTPPHHSASIQPPFLAQQQALLLNLLPCRRWGAGGTPPPGIIPGPAPSEWQC